MNGDDNSLFFCFGHIILSWMKKKEVVSVWRIHRKIISIEHGSGVNIHSRLRVVDWVMRLMISVNRMARRISSVVMYLITIEFTLKQMAEIYSKTHNDVHFISYSSSNRQIPFDVGLRALANIPLHGHR